MKLKALLFLVLAAVLPLAAPQTAQAHADVSFDYFYDALLPYGEWIEVEGHGLCWRPVDVGADWAPYSDGYWAFTDAGWTWVGYEEFAGIVYHYGRWLHVEDEGWCWKPDYEWGPGWVSWRHSDDYIGWAPLPPRAYWQPEIGISTWVDTVCDTGPAFYSFCRVRDFGAPVLRPVIINRTRNVVIIRNTVNITNITYNSYGDSPMIYNGGPSYAFISSRCERPIPTLKLVRRTHFDTPDFHGGPGRWSPNARTVGNQLFVNAPSVAPPERPAFFHDKVQKTFAADKVTNGWAGVKDAKVRDDLRGRFQRETKGLTPYTAPAKAVAVADLKVVPVQADANAVPPGLTGRGPRDKGDRQTPVITGNAVVPGQSANVVAEPAKPMKEGGVTGQPGVVSTEPKPPVDARGAGKLEREKNGGVQVPPAVTGAPLQPFNPGGDGKPLRKDQGAPVVPNADKPVVPDAPVVIEPREGRGPKPMKDAPVGGFHPNGGAPVISGDTKPAKVIEPAPGADPAAAQAAAEAARAAREQAARQQKMDAEKLRATQGDLEKVKGEQERMGRQREADAAATAAREKQQADAAASERTKMQQQKMELEKTRGAQGEADKLRTEQERALRQREADAKAATMQQKQAADAAAASAEKEKMQAQQQQRAAQVEREKLAAEQERMARQREADTSAAAQQKQLDAQRQAEAAKQSDMKHQQAEAQALDRQRQQQEQLAEQRKQLQMEQQRAAQDAAKQQAEAQRQQAAERARAQQVEQQRAAQEAAKQQALEQRRQQQMEQQRAAQDAAKQQAMEQQRAAQDAAKQQAMEQRRQQQIEQQRAAQDAAKQQAMEQQQAAQQQAAQQQAAQAAAQKEKDKDKDKDKNR